MRSFKAALVFAFARSVPALPEFTRRVTALAVLALILLACSPAPPPLAAIDAACSTSSSSPALPASDSSPSDLAFNASAARVRAEAAAVVVAWDGSFSPLGESLGWLSSFASSLAADPLTAPAGVSREDWDFAKYAQAVAADQCAQLYRVVGP